MPRLLRHPGPVAPNRRESRAEARGRAVRFHLLPGRSLHACLVAALGQNGVASAVFTLQGGAFSRLSYCIAAPNPEGPQVARYSDPIEAGPAAAIGGGGALGRDAGGLPLVHCHALFCDAQGSVFGGHVLPHAAIVGDDPPVVHARMFAAVWIAQRPDPETAMSVFHPVPVERAHAV
ncbi:PCC domain-containing protein [Aquabacter spiritensis]|nr:DUF296 domain-containing protein [Aquabacter spiritensis]